MIQLSDGEWVDGQPIYCPFVVDWQVKVYSGIPTVNSEGNFELFESAIEVPPANAYVLEVSARLAGEVALNGLLKTEIQETEAYLAELQGSKKTGE